MIAYVWGGSANDGDLANSLNYIPEGLPTSEDSLLVDSTGTGNLPPSSGSCYAGELTVDNWTISGGSFPNVKKIKFFDSPTFTAAQGINGTNILGMI